jgi:GntR family transcriptional regulator
LINEGLLYRRPGIGTVVGLPKIRPELVKLTSFTEDMQVRGMRPASKTLSVKRVSASEGICDALQLKPGDEVWKIVRLRSANEQPIGIHELHIPTMLGLTQTELENLSSFYELVGQRLGLVPERGFETLTATKASAALAKLLKIKINSPVLAIQRTTFAQTGVAFEYVKMAYRADHYEYYAVQHP